MELLMVEKGTYSGVRVDSTQILCRKFNLGRRKLTSLTRQVTIQVGKALALIYKLRYI